MQGAGYSRTAPTVAQQKHQRERYAEDLHDFADTYEYWLRYGQAGFVYLITEWDEAKNERTGFAKIGFAKAPHARLRTLRTGNPRHLQLAGLFVGTLATERLMHRRWRHFGVHTSSREWYGGGCVDFLRYSFQEIDRQQREIDPYSTAETLDLVVHRVCGVDFTGKAVVDPSDGRVSCV